MKCPAWLQVERVLYSSGNPRSRVPRFSQSSSGQRGTLCRARKPCHLPAPRKRHVRPLVQTAVEPLRRATCVRAGDSRTTLPVSGPAIGCACHRPCPDGHHFHQDRACLLRTHSGEVGGPDHRLSAHMGTPRTLTSSWKRVSILYRDAWQCGIHGWHAPRLHRGRAFGLVACYRVPRWVPGLVCTDAHRAWWLTAKLQGSEGRHGRSAINRQD